MTASATAGNLAPSFSLRSWAWDEARERDLRLDFMRGAVMVVLLVVHLDVYSAYTLFAWSRVGLVSGAEGFVILSGVVLGWVHRRKIARYGWADSTRRLTSRAFQLYRVHVAVILAVWLADALPGFDASRVTSFTDAVSGQIYSLYPATDTPWHVSLASVALLRHGPHQIQILGLYTVLLCVAPLAFLALKHGRWKYVLLVSWLIYAISIVHPGRPTGAQFEYGFQSTAWQLLFFHGMTAGYYRREILAAARQPIGRLAVFLCVLTAFAMFVFVQSDPNPAEPAWARTAWVAPEDFVRIVGVYGAKDALGPLRVLNDFCLFVSVFALLSVAWRPLCALFGWFLIPIGQASLYVFIVHVAFVALLFSVPSLADAGPGYDGDTFWRNTLAHTFVLASIWWMVTRQFLFRWIPR